ncbi:MAG: hypothetical protein K2Q21_08735 [Chitinophagaceae bacterium]|nr:hypothetical protein [Chitinophagaceae bacterium]
MKKIILSFFAFIFAASSFAQIKDPISWKYEAVKKTASSYELIITATVPKPWHIYSQNSGKGGPIPTTIKFKINPLVTVTGNTKEVGKLEKVLDKNFGPKPVQVKYFSDQVQFVQTVTVKGGIKTNISGTVNYMICDDTQCLAPTTKSFDIKLQ